MSKISVTGFREYDFKDDNERQVKGMSVYYAQALEDGEDGLKARGFTTGKLSVKAGTDLYRRMLNADYSKPFEAEAIFDIIPPSKKPMLVDIILPKQ